MDNSTTTSVDEAVGVLLEAVHRASSRVQDAGVQAFAAVEPDQAHREADRLAQVQRAGHLLTELTSALIEIGACHEDGSANRADGHRKPVTGGGARLPDGPAMHPKRLAPAVLEALRQAGGTATLSQIDASVEAQIGDQFTQADTEPMPGRNSVPRWKYNVRWTLTELKNQGLIEHAGKPGVWRLAR